jgi:transketolase
MTLDDRDIQRLQELARSFRVNIIRMIAEAGSGHPGGSLSAIDIITYLYYHRLRIDPANPQLPDRDRFVMSKGHCSPAVYVALAARGYFPEDWLWTLRDVGSKLQGHPDMRKTPGIDMTTGSLGQSFSCATGIALGGRVQGTDFRVYCMLGDGEIQEGIVWEAALAAAHYKLDNLIAIVDNNRCQTDGFTADIMNIEPVEDKWRAFGWNAHRADGHDFRAIHQAIECCQARNGRPHVIVADTIKGKGLREMENNPYWHGVPPKKDQAARFVEELLAGGQE